MTVALLHIFSAHFVSLLLTHPPVATNHHRIYYLISGAFISQKSHCHCGVCVVLIRVYQVHGKCSSHVWIFKHCVYLCMYTCILDTCTLQVEAVGLQLENVAHLFLCTIYVNCFSVIH